jgi:large subunit ribosomal protein L18
MATMRSADSREKRKRRVRKKVRGTSGSPRLSVYRSSKNIYAQIIDDTMSKTLVDASSLSKGASDDVRKKGGNKEGAALIGKLIAERALKSGIKKVVFDRNGFLYHGRIKALAEAAREGGLEF